MTALSVAGDLSALALVAFFVVCAVGAMQKPTVSKGLSPGTQVFVGAVFGLIVGLAIIGVIS